MDAKFLLMGAMLQHLQDIVLIMVFFFALKIAAEVVALDVAVYLPEGWVRLAIGFATFASEVVVYWHLLAIFWFDVHILWWGPALSLPHFDG